MGETREHVAENGVPPRPAALSVAGGLVLMAVFSVFWTSLAGYGWQGAAAVLPPVVAAVGALLFLVRAARLFAGRHRFPVLTDPNDVAQGKRLGNAYGVVFGLEGLVIGVVAVVLGRAGLPDYIVPAIALVVGLHFYPMAWIFDRTIDYWIATWVCVVAIVGLVLIARGAASVPACWSLVGVATGLGTLAYGVYMYRVSGPWLAAVSRREPSPTR